MAVSIPFWRRRARAAAMTLAKSAQARSPDSCSDSRSLRARAGDAPPVEIATVTGPRCTMEGAMKLQLGGSSTALSITPRASASSKMRRLTSRLLVAAMAMNAPARSPGR